MQGSSSETAPSTATGSGIDRTTGRNGPAKVAAAEPQDESNLTASASGRERDFKQQSNTVRNDTHWDTGRERGFKQQSNIVRIDIQWDTGYHQ